MFVSYVFYCHCFGLCSQISCIGTVYLDSFFRVVLRVFHRVFQLIIMQVTYQSGRVE